ncbi:MAG TPA: GNAT family N-acetyltransferase [Halomonas sp.]|nr:GNAT family N-acetyltransferase [Halomonas sp.]
MSTPAIELRALGPDDLPALLALERASPSTRWSEAQWAAVLVEAGLAEKTTAVLGVWCEEQLAGHAVLVNLGLDAELQAIAVAPPRRRRGLARRLLDGVIEHAVGWGSEALLLEVRAGNAPALALYRRAGFVADGYRRGYYPALGSAVESDGREDACLMSRALVAARAEPAPQVPEG